MIRTVVVGWFSYKGMNATAGDILAGNVARRWLEEAGRSVVLAAAEPFHGDVTISEVDPLDVDELVFVCGPFRRRGPIPELLERFRRSRLIGLDLSILTKDPIPFDVLIERDSDTRANPDLALASSEPTVPLIGLLEVHPQKEYGDRARHREVGHIIAQALNATAGAVLPIDTRPGFGTPSARSAAEVETFISRCDVVVTTRLHGMVLALKHGVPAVVVDPIHNGAKVYRQAIELGWPVIFTPETVTPDAVAEAIAECLTSELRERARRCAADGIARLDLVRRELTAQLGASSPTRPEAPHQPAG